MNIGCISLNDYAVKYRASSPIQTDKEEEKNYEGEQTHRCHYFRNQLVAASEAAQEHIWWVWAFPGYWPLHILTLYILPVDETRTANKVIKAAQKMERAYQTSDAEFLNVCKKLFNEPELGPAFMQENPLHKP